MGREKQVGTKKLMRGPKVVKTVDKPLTWRDKLKNYWKFAIASLGSFLIALDQLSPVFNAIPVSKPTVTITIAVATAALTLLKGNEQWIES